MKVVLKVSVLDRIIEEFHKAARACREVDFVAVTRDEYAELRMDIRVHSYIHSGLDFRIATQAMDAAVRTRDFQCLDASRSWRGYGDYIRCVSYEQIPLFVVPAEYCPR